MDKSLLHISEDDLDVQKHKEIKDRGLRFAEVLHGKEKETVMSIVNASSDFIKQAGNEENIVYEPTNKDLGRFLSAVKIYVRTDFIKPAISGIKELSEEFRDIEGICHKCIDHDQDVYRTPELGVFLAEYEMCDECREKLDYRLEINLVQYRRRRKIEREFLTAVEQTKFQDQLIGNWVLLKNRMNEEKESKHLDNTLKDFIRNELVNDFINQNKQLLKKYDLWQSQ